MLILFHFFAALLIIQGVASLLEGLRFRAFIHNSLREAAGPFAPRVSIIAPCKGIDIGLEQNLEALFTQEYPDYEIIFVIASTDDPARPVIERLIEYHEGRRARLVVARPASGRGEKVNNLLAALDHVRPESEALCFVDSDARVGAGWLRALVAPLEDEKTGAATGYRWYLPQHRFRHFSQQAAETERGGFRAALLSAWNGSIATTLGDHGRNFAWGGSTAILRKTFARIDVRARWENAVSDDYALTKAVRDAGLGIRFVPRCLVAARENPSLASLLEFTTRQIIITRVYNPSLWWTGIISHALFCSVFFGGVAFITARAISGSPATGTALMIGTIYALGSLKGWLRLIAAREALAHAREEITRLWWMLCFLWPLVSLLFLYNFAKSATTRRITWRGVTYEMRSPDSTIIINPARLARASDLR